MMKTPNEKSRGADEGWRIRSPEPDAAPHVVRRHNAHTAALVEKVVARKRGEAAARLEQQKVITPRQVDVVELERELQRVAEQLAGLRRRAATREESEKRGMLIRAAEIRAASIVDALDRARRDSGSASGS